MPKNNKTKKSTSGANKSKKDKRDKSKSGDKVSEAAAALRAKKSTPNNEAPENNGDAAAPEAPAAPFKLLVDLTADEARKECVKLKLIETGAKEKRELCLIRLSEFLGSRGLTSLTFKFGLGGTTEFPAALFDKTPDNNSGSDDSDESEESDSESSDEEEEETIDLTRKSKKKKNKRVSFQDDKRTRKSKPKSTPVFGGGNVPDGWYVMPHPVTKLPVGMLRESDGKLLELRDPAVSPSMPTAFPSTPSQANYSNPNTARQISQAAAMLGAGVGISAQAARENFPSQSAHSGISNHVRSMQNAEFCNASIPSFVYNQEKEQSSTRKMVSGMYTTGKKEVMQKEIYPHHMIDSLINPEGVEYFDMNIQELNNGFTAMILSKCNDETDPTVVNMLKHLNRINAYLMFAPLSTVLEFNGGFMRGLENRTQSWENGAKMMQYHDRHLQSLKLSGSREDNPKKKDDQGTSDKNDKAQQKQKCTRDWVLKKGICFNYQNDQCDQPNGHDDGNGKAQVHSCAWCSFSDKGYLLHNNTTCEDRKNPFRKTRPQSGQ